MSPDSRSRPNVVLILPHDLGAALGCLGSGAHTPHADRLAREGVLVEGLYAAGVLASPSRASLLTGCYPHTHRLLGPLPEGWLLDADRCPPLGRLLAGAGYDAHLFGFQHEHVRAAALGYAHEHALPSYHAEAVAAAFEGWLAGRDGGARPFYAVLSPWEAHRLGLNPSHYRREAYTPPDAATVDLPGWLPDLPATRQDWAGYLGAVEHADRLVGRVLAALEASGALDDTLVILTTDTGPSAMHAKATLYDGGTHLAWAMRWPGRLPAGGRVGGLASQVDILPTVLDLLGLPVPPTAEGQSLRAALEGGGPAPRQAVFAERNYDPRLQPARMARTLRWKYTRRAAAHCIYDEVIQELELSAGNFRESRPMFAFYAARRVREELYDLRADPAELHNLAEDPAHAGPLAEMRALLDAHLAATSDPFSEVRLATPEDPDAYVKVRANPRAQA